MNELDLLKQHWQQDNNFPQVKRNEIRKMLYKSSSSLVKWIFYISIIELFVGIGLNIWSSQLNLDDKADPIFYQIAITAVDTLAYIFILYFIYKFFTSYRMIRSTNNTKKLLETILDTRKTVYLYIKFNIYLIIFSMILGAGSVIWQENFGVKSVGEIIFYTSAMAIMLFLMGWLVISVMRLYYRLIYIRLVKKLDKNYEELVRLEEEEEHGKTP